MDRIVLGYKGNKKISEIIEKNKDSICGDVLANKLSTNATSGYEKEWNINGEEVTLSVEKI
jgi:isoleucyl-tRNA synthetase